jgi:hypothetical protein
LAGEKIAAVWNAKRKDTIMGNSKRAIVIGLAAAITFGTTLSSSAAPVLSSTAIVGATAPTDVSNVYYRHYRGRGLGVGLALGLVGAGIAASAYRNNYYDQGYYRRGYGPYYGYEQDPGYYGRGYGSGYRYRY